MPGPILSYWNSESESGERENKEGFGEDHDGRSYSKVVGKYRRVEEDDAGDKRW